MTPELIRAAVRLADLLRAENDALAVLDLAGAAALLDGKQEAASAFATLVGAQPPEHGTPPTETRAIAGELRELSQENRRLLERAIKVQNRVIGTVTRAASAVATGNAPRYGRSGAMTAADGGVALVAQV